MTDAELSALETAANIAFESTQGVWDVTSEKIGPISTYIDIANPVTILELIAELKEYKQLAKRDALYIRHLQMETVKDD